MIEFTSFSLSDKTQSCFVHLLLKMIHYITLHIANPVFLICTVKCSLFPTSVYVAQSSLKLTASVFSLP